MTLWKTSPHTDKLKQSECGRMWMNTMYVCTLAADTLAGPTVCKTLILTTLIDCPINEKHER